MKIIEASISASGKSVIGLVLNSSKIDLTINLYPGISYQKRWLVWTVVWINSVHLFMI